MRRYAMACGSLTLALLTGCNAVVGSGRLATERRDLTGFSRVAAESGVTVEAKVAGEGEAESVVVEADDNLLPLITTDVRDKTLRVGLQGSIRSSHPLRVQATVKTLDGVSAAAGASVQARGVTSPKFEADASSGGSVVVSGKTDELVVQASSGGSVDGKGLSAAKVEVDASSGGSATVSASAELTGNASSGGQIRHVGRPARVEVKTSSGGSVGP